MILLLAMVHISSAQAGLLPPEFEVDVVFDSPPQELSVSEDHEVAAIATIECTSYSASMATDPVEFSIDVSMTTEGLGSPFALSHQKGFNLTVEPFQCLDGSKISYRYTIGFGLPSDYPAYTRLIISTAVTATNAIGAGNATWESMVRYGSMFSPEVTYTIMGSQRVRTDAYHPDEVRREVDMRVWLRNDGNARISGTMVRSNDSHPGVRMEDVAFGPFDPGRSVVDFQIHLDDSARQAGIYRLVYNVDAWLSDTPDHRLLPEVLMTDLKVVEERRQSYDLPPIAPLVAISLLLGAVFLFQRKPGPP